MNKNVSVQVSPGLPTLLTILFVTLKLTGYITWSWWWVVSPMWLPLAVFSALFLIVIIFLGIVFTLEAIFQ